MALNEAGQPDEAYAQYGLVVAIGDPDQTPRALRNMAAQLNRRGDVNGARDLLRQAIALRHPLWSRWAAHHLVNIELRDGDGVAAAIAVLEPLESWRDDPPTAIELWLHGRLRYLRNDVDGAIEFFRSAVDRGAERFTDVAARVLAEIYCGRGEYQTAVHFARRAVTLYEADGDLPGAARAEVLAGEALLAQNHIEPARRAYLRALKYPATAEPAQARFRLAWMELDEAATMPAPRLRRRLAARALQLLEEVGTPDDPWLRVNTRYGRARAHELLNDVAAARSEYLAALDLASPASRSTLILRYAGFLVRTGSKDEAIPLLDSLIADGDPAVSDAAGKLRERARTRSV